MSYVWAVAYVYLVVLMAILVGISAGINLSAVWICGGCKWALAHLHRAALWCNERSH